MVQTFLAWITLAALSGLAFAETPQPQHFILTSHENGFDSESVFACSGSIHGYLTFPKSEMGKHVLEGIWIGPKGLVVQHSRDDVNYPPPGHRTAAIWLQFTKEGGHIWNPLSVQAPEDSDRMAYDGPWKVKVRWDDQEVAQSEFQVHCSKEAL